MSPPARQSGFSLIELSIVLVAMALLSGGLIAILPARQELNNAAATESQLNEAREALLGFASANGYLPCPAKSASDGNEDRSAGICSGGKRNGLLPWVSLGLPRTDSWGRLIRYSIAPAYASSNSYFTLATAGDITIRTRNDSGTLVDLTKPAETIAALWSTGRNGYWGWQADNASQNPDSTGANDDEDVNSATAATGILLISRPPTPAGSSQGEFDDTLIWLPRYPLFNRMIAAGRLP